MTEGQANALLVLLERRAQQFHNHAEAMSQVRVLDREHARAVAVTYNAACKMLRMAMDGRLDESVYRLDEQ